jgi:hypothetical protein
MSCCAEAQRAQAAATRRHAVAQCAVNQGVHTAVNKAARNAYARHGPQLCVASSPATHPQHLCAAPPLLLKEGVIATRPTGPAQAYTHARLLLLTGAHQQTTPLGWTAAEQCCSMLCPQCSGSCSCVAMHAFDNAALHTGHVRAEPCFWRCCCAVTRTPRPSMRPAPQKESLTCWLGP